MTSYRNTVDFVVQAISACWVNARTLSGEAQAISERGQHPLALSIAVLALEEVGKLLMADGLLLATPGDNRSEQFVKGSKSHRTKLERIHFFPYFVRSMSVLDPRASTEVKFGQALAISMQQDREVVDQIMAQLGNADSLASLDTWKQAGFYVHNGKSGALCTPAETVSQELSRVVVLLARRIVGTLDFLLKDNLERYHAMAINVRSSLTPDEALALRASIELVLSVAEENGNAATN